MEILVSDKFCIRKLCKNRWDCLNEINFRMNLFKRFYVYSKLIDHIFFKKIFKNWDLFDIWDLLNIYNSLNALNKIWESFGPLNTGTVENLVEIFCFRFSW